MDDRHAKPRLVWCKRGYRRAVSPEVQRVLDAAIAERRLVSLETMDEGAVAVESHGLSTHGVKLELLAFRTDTQTWERLDVRDIVDAELQAEHFAQRSSH